MNVSVGDLTAALDAIGFGSSCVATTTTEEPTLEQDGVNAVWAIASALGESDAHTVHVYVPQRKGIFLSGVGGACKRQGPFHMYAHDNNGMMLSWSSRATYLSKRRTGGAELVCYLSGAMDSQDETAAVLVYTCHGFRNERLRQYGTVVFLPPREEDYFVASLCYCVVQPRRNKIYMYNAVMYQVYCN